MSDFEGLHSAPLAKHPEEGADFPQWVEPHPSHVKRDHAGRVVTPNHEQHHVDRSGKVTVLVHNADEAAEAKEPAAEDTE